MEIGFETWAGAVRRRAKRIYGYDVTEADLAEGFEAGFDFVDEVLYLARKYNLKEEL